MGNFQRLTILIICCMSLISCQASDRTIESIDEHLTATVLIEEDFEEYQEKVNQLESEEHDIYNQLIALGNDQQEDVKELTNEAVQILDEKMAYIDLIKETLSESRSEFEKIESSMDQIKDENHFDFVDKMYETMINRYHSYDDVYEAYFDSVQLTSELYEEF